MPTSAFNSLSTLCQYLTMYCLLFLSILVPLFSTFCPTSVSTSMYPLFVLCHYVHWCLQQSLHCLSVLHSVISVFSVSMSTHIFYSLSTVCQYLTLYRLFVLCHCVHCCLLHALHFLTVPESVPSLCPVSLCPMLFSTVSSLLFSTSNCTFFLFCVTTSTSVV